MNLLDRLMARNKNVFFMFSMFSQVSEATGATGEDRATDAAKRAMKARCKWPALTGLWKLLRS